MPIRRISMSMKKTNSSAPSSTSSYAILPVGTRIKFIRRIESGPDEFSPGNLYAAFGELGEVVGHGCHEGHWVKTDSWPVKFGAKFTKDFVKLVEDNGEDWPTACRHGIRGLCGECRAAMGSR